MNHDSGGTSPQALVFDAAGVTDTGRVRATNEDTYLIAAFHRSMRVIDASAGAKQPGWSSGQLFGSLYMVADGMGGHGGGDIASQSAVDAIANYLIHLMPCANSMLDSLPEDARSSLHDLRGKLSSAVLAADEAIRTQSAFSSAPEMGTTLTIAFVTGSSLYVAHVGDSRCYLLRNSQLLQLTNDHTVANQLADKGDRFAQEAKQLNHILWNCLGGGDDTRPSPDVFKLELAPDDRLLLCTDGLTNELDEEEIAAQLLEPGTSREICARLVEAANQRGGNDNVTVILAQPVQPHDQTRG